MPGLILTALHWYFTSQGLAASFAADVAELSLLLPLFLIRNILQRKTGVCDIRHPTNLE